MSRLGIDDERIASAARRVMARCDELAKVSAKPDAIERVYLSREHAHANRLVAAWMRETGMSTWQDAAGNQIGRIRIGPGSAEPDDAPALILGSHLDTVSDGGRYDGMLGVLMAIEVVRLLAAPGAATLPFAIEVIAFWDEEGTRFGKALLGSSAAAGTWQDDWWSLTDADGTTLREAFVDFGLDPAQVGDAARRPGEIVGYLEAHIEQGPQLDRSREALAVVSSIAGARRFELVVEGEARHAGGTPYDARRDALLGAGEAALAVERVCRAEHHIIGTVGRFEAFPGGINVVPGEVRFTLDLRGELDPARDEVWERLVREFDAIAGRRGLRWSAREIHDAAAVRCAPLLQDVVGAGIQAATGARTDPIRLFSPAGHDGMAMSAIADVGMLFLRNADGISHHPAESVQRGDVARGIRALAESVLHLAAEPVRVGGRR